MRDLWDTIYWHFSGWEPWFTLPLRVVLFLLMAPLEAVFLLFRFYDLDEYGNRVWSWPGIGCRLLVIGVLVACGWWVQRVRYDPVRHAATLGAELAQREAQFREMEGLVRQRLRDLEVPVPKRDLQDAGAGVLHTVVAERLALANTLRDSYEQVLTSMRGLQACYRQGPEVFGGAGARYRAWAGGTDFEALRADYEIAAEAWEDLARNAERQTQWLTRADDDLRAALAAVGEVQLLLARLDTFLKSFPNALRGDAERVDLLRRVQQSMTKYQELRGELEALHRKIIARPAEIAQGDVGEVRN